MHWGSSNYKGVGMCIPVGVNTHDRVAVALQSTKRLPRVGVPDDDSVVLRAPKTVSSTRYHIITKKTTAVDGLLLDRVSQSGSL